MRLICFYSMIIFIKAVRFRDERINDYVTVRDLEVNINETKYVTDSTTVGLLRETIISPFFPRMSLVLYFNGQPMLHLDRTLKDYCVENGSIIYLSNGTVQPFSLPPVFRETKVASALLNVIQKFKGQLSPTDIEMIANAAGTDEFQQFLIKHFYGPASSAVRPQVSPASVQWMATSSAVRQQVIPVHRSDASSASGIPVQHRSDASSARRIPVTPMPEYKAPACSEPDPDET